ncbi:MAG TPA: DUF2252 family protein [Candidatus Microthrix sp.]|nr:DUF2252 family protein [Candidatus Microthrix sp.]HMS49593.1 DUF2252 family protein [Candidatus Microthrix sp.]
MSSRGGWETPPPIGTRHVAGLDRGRRRPVLRSPVLRHEGDPRQQRIGPHLRNFAFACGGCLARAHARSGDPLAIASYLGRGKAHGDGVTDFAVAYAAQTQADHAELVAAIDAGTVKAAMA